MSRGNARVSFHTGLLAIDYSDFPAFPHRGAGWHIELLPPDSEKYPNAIVRGDEFSPAARELVVFAKGEGQAQKAADLIHSVRHLLDCSNVMSHLSPFEHPAIWPMTESRKRTPKMPSVRVRLR
jgi:hypothetical protein